MGTCYNWFTAYPKVRGCQLYSRVGLDLKEDCWDWETGRNDHASTWTSCRISRGLPVLYFSCFISRPNEEGQKLGTSWHTGLLTWATKTWKEPFLCRGPVGILSSLLLPFTVSTPAQEVHRIPVTLVRTGSLHSGAYALLLTTFGLFSGVSKQNSPGFFFFFKPAWIWIYFKT